MDDFYVILPSNTPVSGNTASHFTVRLPQTLELDSSWLVSLASIIYPFSFPTVGIDDEEFIEIKTEHPNYKREKKGDKFLFAKIPIPSMHYRSIDQMQKSLNQIIKEGYEKEIKWAAKSVQKRSTAATSRQQPPQKDRSPSPEERHPLVEKSPSPEESASAASKTPIDGVLTPIPRSDSSGGIKSKTSGGGGDRTLEKEKPKLSLSDLARLNMAKSVTERAWREAVKLSGEANDIVNLSHALRQQAEWNRQRAPSAPDVQRWYTHLVSQVRRLEQFAAKANDEAKKAADAKNEIATHFAVHNLQGARICADRAKKALEEVKKFKKETSGLFNRLEPESDLGVKESANRVISAVNIFFDPPEKVEMPPGEPPYPPGHPKNKEVSAAETEKELPREDAVPDKDLPREEPATVADKELPREDKKSDDIELPKDKIPITGKVLPQSEKTKEKELIKEDKGVPGREQEKELPKEKTADKAQPEKAGQPTAGEKPLKEKEVQQTKEKPLMPTAEFPITDEHDDDDDDEILPGEPIIVDKQPPIITKQISNIAKKGELEPIAEETFPETDGRDILDEDPTMLIKEDKVAEPPSSFSVSEVPQKELEKDPNAFPFAEDEDIIESAHAQPMPKPEALVDGDHTKREEAEEEQFYIIDGEKWLVKDQGEHLPPKLEKDPSYIPKEGELPKTNKQASDRKEAEFWVIDGEKYILKEQPEGLPFLEKVSTVSAEEGISVEFRFDVNIQKFQVLFGKDVFSILLSKQLAYVLGYEQTRLYYLDTAKYVPDLSGGVKQLYVYAPKLVENSIIGNRLAPLLRVVNISGNEGTDVQEVIYTNEFFHQIQNKRISEITIEIQTPFGRYVKFNWGTCVLTLHFKRKFF